MGIARLIMIVNQIDLGGGICFPVVTENQPPISRYGEAPEFF
jgi:hypothetical protein